MSLFKKKLKIGRRVAVAIFNIKENRDEFKTGKIVAIKPKVEGNYWDYNYAVRFDDGRIRTYRAQQLFTEWEKE